MTQIPVKHFKSLMKPSVPEANGLYFVQPDSASPVEFYLTDQNGAYTDPGNSDFIKAVIDSYKTATMPILLSSTPIDLNEGTAAKQPLYTVPASRRAIITRIDLEKLSAAPTIAEFTMGWNTGATDTLDPFLLSDLVPAATKFGSVLAQPTSWLVGTATQVLGFAVSTPEGTALTARVNVFGYLTDTNGVPIANV